MSVPVNAVNALNGGFASPLADADYAVPLNDNAAGFLSWIFNGLTGFNLIAFGLLTVILYDQCESFICKCSDFIAAVHG